MAHTKAAFPCFDVEIPRPPSDQAISAIASRCINGFVVLLAIASLACEKKVAQKATSPKPQTSPSVSALPEKVEVPEVRVRTSASTTVRVGWVTPRGTAVNDEAPFRVRWNRSDGLADAPPDVKSTGSAVKDGFRVNVRPMAGAPNASLTGEINIVVCDSATHSVCVPVRRDVELGFVVANDAAAEATVSIPLPEARVVN
jgi:hypothetical protein